MNNYEIFDLSLPDSYIMELSLDDLHVLLTEASYAWNDLEEELDELMWSDDPRGNGFLAYTPAPPSEYTYHPSLYGPQIDADPSFRVKLGRAEQLASLAGSARAIRETVLMVLEGRNA